MIGFTKTFQASLSCIFSASPPPFPLSAPSSFPLSLSPFPFSTSLLLFLCYVTSIAGSALGETRNTALKLILGHPTKSSWISTLVYNSLSLLEEVTFHIQRKPETKFNAQWFGAQQNPSCSWHIHFSMEQKSQREPFVRKQPPAPHPRPISMPGKGKLEPLSDIPREWQGFLYSLLWCWQLWKKRKCTQNSPRDNLASAGQSRFILRDRNKKAFMQSSFSKVSIFERGPALAACFSQA